MSQKNIGCEFLVLFFPFSFLFFLLACDCEIDAADLSHLLQYIDRYAEAYRLPEESEDNEY
jgi:hypothetical protein